MYILSFFLVDGAYQKNHLVSIFFAYFFCGFEKKHYLCTEFCLFARTRA